MSDLEEFKRYKIGEIAKILEVKPYVLRFWESEFPSLVPIRTPSGQRVYTEENLALLRRIKRLLYGEGLTLEGTRKRLSAEVPDDFLYEVEEELDQIARLLGSQTKKEENNAHEDD